MAWNRYGAAISTVFDAKGKWNELSMLGEKMRRGKCSDQRDKEREGGRERENRIGEGCKKEREGGN